MTTQSDREKAWDKMRVEAFDLMMSANSVSQGLDSVFQRLKAKDLEWQAKVQGLVGSAMCAASASEQSWRTDCANLYKALTQFTSGQPAKCTAVSKEFPIEDAKAYAAKIDRGATRESILQSYMIQMARWGWIEAIKSVGKEK